MNYNDNYSEEESLWAAVVRKAFLEEEDLRSLSLRDLKGTGKPWREAFQTEKTA